MKKILSTVLCLVMILSLGVTAFAETNEFVLTYSNEASYEISIPESGNIDVTNGKGTITIGVTETNLADGTVVSVTATSANYTDDSWYLVNTKDSSDKMAYTVGTTDGGSDVASGDEVLSADSATSTTLYVTLSDTSKIGTFTDTITFTSEIEAAMVTVIVNEIDTSYAELYVKGDDNMLYGGTYQFPVGTILVCWISDWSDDSDYDGIVINGSWIMGAGHNSSITYDYNLTKNVTIDVGADVLGYEEGRIEITEQ